MTNDQCLMTKGDLDNKFFPLDIRHSGFVIRH